MSDEPNSTTDRLAALEAQVDALETDHEEKLEDVRNRVIQVKRELDAIAGRESEVEAPEPVQETVADHAAAIEDLQEKVEMLASSAIDVHDQLDDLAYDDLATTIETMAASLRDVQDQLQEVSSTATARADLDSLLDEAQSSGVIRADCGACDEAVELGILTEPRCPHCGARFTEIVAGGVIRSAVLETEAT